LHAAFEEETWAAWLCDLPKPHGKNALLEEGLVSRQFAMFDFVSQRCVLRDYRNIER
jgi:hypothetical protein